MLENIQAQFKQLSLSHSHDRKKMVDTLSQLEETSNQLKDAKDELRLLREENAKLKVKKIFFIVCNIICDSI